MLGRPHELWSRLHNRPGANVVGAGWNGSRGSKRKCPPRVEEMGLEARSGLGIRVLLRYARGYHTSDIFCTLSVYCQRRLLQAKSVAEGQSI